MEAVAALSLAGTILQFVDFSSKIFSKSREIYESSSHALTVNEEIEKAVEELNTLTAKLQQPLNQTGNGYGPSPRKTKEDAALNELCVTCQKIAGELQARLIALKGQGKHQRWDSFRGAIKGAWAEKDIEVLMKRLSVLREALEMHMLINIRQSFEVETAKSSDRFEQVDKQTRAILDALVDIRATVAENVQDQTVMTQILHNTNHLMKNQKISSQNTNNLTIILGAVEKVVPLSEEDRQRKVTENKASAMAQKEWQDFEDEKLSIGASIL